MGSHTSSGLHGHVTHTVHTKTGREKHSYTSNNNKPLKIKRDPWDGIDVTAEFHHTVKEKSSQALIIT